MIHSGKYDNHKVLGVTIPDVWLHQEMYVYSYSLRE